MPWKKYEFVAKANAQDKEQCTVKSTVSTRHPSACRYARRESTASETTEAKTVEPTSDVKGPAWFRSHSTMSAWLVQKNRVTLTDKADFQHIRDQAIQDDVFTQDEVDIVEAEKTRHQKMSKCLDMMYLKPPKIIEAFFTALRKADKVVYDQVQWHRPLESDEQKATGTSANEVTTDLGKVQAELINWYQRQLSKLHPLPWCEWFEINLRQVFTNLKMIPALKHRLSSSESPRSSTEEEWSNTDSKGNKRSSGENRLQAGVSTTGQLAEALWNTNGRTITFVEGQAGYGKSTLCRQLAYLWSTSNREIHGRTFDLVVILEARNLGPVLKDCILQQLLPEEIGVNGDSIYNCIKECGEKCLFILDGVDELPASGEQSVRRLLEGDVFRSANVLFTGRPEVADKFIQWVDRHLKITGFTPENVKSYISSYFDQAQGDKAELDQHRRHLLECLEKNKNLAELAVNPFTTLLLCILVSENAGKIPSNHSDVLQEIVMVTCKRHVHKVNKKSSVPMKTTVTDVCEAAGHVAYNCFRTDKLDFPESTVIEVCGDEVGKHLLNSGLLNRDFTVSRLHTSGYCYFPHKSIQEFLCAHYFANLSPESLQRELAALPFSYQTCRGVFKCLFDLLKEKKKKPLLNIVLSYFLEGIFSKVDNRAYELLLHMGSEDLTDAESRNDLFDLSADIICKNDRLHRQICRNMVSDINMDETKPSPYARLEQLVLQKASLKPVVIPVYVKIRKSRQVPWHKETHLCPRACRQRPNLSTRMLGRHKLKICFCSPCFHEKVLHYYTNRFVRFPGLTLPWVHCESIQAAIAVLKDTVTIHVLSILLFPGMYTQLGLKTLLNDFKSVRHPMRVIFIAPKHPHDDHLYLKAVALLNCGQFPNVQIHTYFSKAHFAAEQHSKDTQSNRVRVYVLTSSPHRIFHETSSPY